MNDVQHLARNIARIDNVIASWRRDMPPYNRNDDDPRICPFRGTAFCAYCPDGPHLPCVVAGQPRDCREIRYFDDDGNLQTIPACEYGLREECPCMQLPTLERCEAYEAWENELERANSINARWHKALAGRRLWLADQESTVCSECGTPISSQNKTGMCLPCFNRRRAYMRWEREREVAEVTSN